MKEHPILFSSAMVNAILEGNKTQTRRVIQNKTALEWLEPNMFSPAFVADPGNFLCMYGYASDKLWVKETFQTITKAGNESWTHDDPKRGHVDVLYRADAVKEGWDNQCPWNPSIFMPRWASRIALEIVKIRCERLQEIAKPENSEDVFSEGLLKAHYTYADEDDNRDIDTDEALDDFAALWNSINAKRGFGWEANPWVWVIEFKKV